MSTRGQVPPFHSTAMLLLLLTVLIFFVNILDHEYYRPYNYCTLCHHCTIVNIERALTYMSPALYTLSSPRAEGLLRGLPFLP